MLGHKFVKYGPCFRCFWEFAEVPTPVHLRKDRTWQRVQRLVLVGPAGCPRSYGWSMGGGRGQGQTGHCSSQGLLLIGWGPPTLQRAISFTQSKRVNAIQKYPQRNTQNNIWPNMLPSHGSAKLTHTVNHHRKVRASWRKTLNARLVFRLWEPLKI